jgi:uncharacterized protein with HEPN domain
VSVNESRDQRHLRYIRASIQLIEDYTRDGGKEAFLTEPLIRDAVLRRLETLAEAAGKLSDAVKERHPEIPWRAVVGFRNIAAHAYLDLLAERTWEIVDRYLPPLLEAVEAELRRAGIGDFDDP